MNMDEWLKGRDYSPTKKPKKYAASPLGHEVVLEG